MRPNLIAGLPTLLALALLAAPAPAQDPTVDASGRYLSFQFDETNGEKLENFIHLARMILDKPMKYDPQEVNNVNIRIIGTPQVERERFFQFFQAVLRAYDFIVVLYAEGAGDFYSIQRISASARGGAAGGVVKATAPIVPLESLEKYRYDPGTLITTSIPLKYIDGRAAMATFNPFFDSQVESIRNVENSNSLVITGFGTNVWGAFQLVGLVDVPPFQPLPTIRKRELANASVDEVEPVLTELLAAARGLRPGQTQAPQAAGALVAREVEPRIIVDVRSNSLLITADADMVDRIESWIDILDVEVEPRGFTHVVRLKNTDAGSIQEVLEKVLSNEASGQQSRTGQGGAVAGGANSLEITPSVVADATSNSLIVTASDRKYAEIVETLRQLDVRRRQVLIECAIVETTESLNDLFEAGVAAGDEKLGGFASNFGTPILGSTTTTSGDSTTTTTNIDVGQTLSDSLQNGFSLAKISDGAIPIPLFIRWLQGRTKTRVLSRPSLLTNDNEEAELASETETAYQTTTQGSQGFSSTNYETVKAGIRLGVSPTISAGNYLRLTVKLEVSDFSDSRSGIPGAPPDVTIREITTPITVPDSSTIVLGGLVSKTQLNTESKVPLLGDLPLVGWLFRSKNDTLTDRFLYVFITAHIIDTDFALLDEITQARMSDVERLGGDLSELSGSLSADESELDAQGLAGLDPVFDMPTVAVPTWGERGAAVAAGRVRDAEAEGDS